EVALLLRWKSLVGRYRSQQDPIALEALRHGCRREFALPDERGDSPLRAVGVETLEDRGTEAFWRDLVEQLLRHLASPPFASDWTPDCSFRLENPAFIWSMWRDLPPPPI